jgi:hypothetical protein
MNKRKSSTTKLREVRRVRANKDKNKLSGMIKVRVSEFEHNRIKGLAGFYAKGNVSLYLIYQALHAPRTYINEEVLWDSRRKMLPKQGRKK